MKRLLSMFLLGILLLGLACGEPKETRDGDDNPPSEPHILGPDLGSQ